MLDLRIDPIGDDDETAFRNLFQFYIYEFSRWYGWMPNSGGRFPEGDLDGVWESEAGRKGFLLRVEGQLAGLAIVDQYANSRYSSDTDMIGMSEFFVMAGYQGKGIGERAAIGLFDLFRGKWEVFQMPLNVNAQAFWRKVIGRYTQGRYREMIREDGAVIQFFDNS